MLTQAGPGVPCFRRRAGREALTVAQLRAPNRMGTDRLAGVGRYSSPLPPDDLWDAIAPLLPPPRPRPKGGRGPIENRAALTGILFVLRSGLSREMLTAEMGCGCRMSCWRRLRDWQEKGVWAQLHQILLERLHTAGEIDWNLASLDSASVPEKRGPATSPNPRTEARRARSGHLVTDARGTPLGLCLSGANRHDSPLLAPTLDAILPLRNGQRGRLRCHSQPDQTVLLDALSPASRPPRQ